MGKLSYGVPNRHIQVSQGGDSDVMKFYCTQYGTSYAKKFAKFQPRTGRHTGTGYLSNFRPGVYYSARIDELDNPAMGRLVADNYESVTHKGFKPYQSADGREPLPNTTKQVGSGFVREKPLTVPTVDDVRNVCIDTRMASGPADFMPRARPRLHKLQPKDTVELENDGYGPGYMTTETQQRFRGQQPDRSDLSKKSPGMKEGSGFTHAHSIEPITFQPDYAHTGEVPGWFTNRPTGVSIMKTDFGPSRFPKGDESLPKLANRSDRDTGFTNASKAKPAFVHRVLSDAYDVAGDVPQAKLDRTRKQDPAEYLNMTNPNNYSSMSKATFRPNYSAPDLGRTKVGRKEPTGYCENNDTYVYTTDNPARFITHYDTRYMDRTAKDLDRAGHTWGGVQPQKEDGFTRSTEVHTNSNGRPLDTTGSLRKLEPYVARSIKARDTHYDDHTHDSKMHRSTTLCY